MTNKRMGKRLLPSPQMKELIQLLVDYGSITGDLKETWNKKVEEKQDKEDLLKKARDGDAEAAYKVYHYFYHGLGSFQKDAEQTFKWLKKACQGDDINATEMMGLCLILGFCGTHGIAKNEVEGAMLLAHASGRGSAGAAEKLFYMYYCGIGPFPHDKEKAIYWLKKAIETSGPYRLGNSEVLEELMQEIGSA